MFTTKDVVTFGLYSFQCLDTTCIKEFNL